jgi:epimerase transport system membrane fusion protein
MSNENNCQNKSADQQTPKEEMEISKLDQSESSSHDAEEDGWEAGDSSLPGDYIKEEKCGETAQDRTIPTDTSRRVRVGIIVLLVTFLGLGGWAALAPLHGAAIATGRVVVNSENRVVQHLEGGIISTISVEEGEEVDKGEVLLQLSDTKARSELEVVESQLMEVLGREARLLAERMDADNVDFPEELTSRDTAEAESIVQGHRALFQSRRESFKGQGEIFEQRGESLTQQIKGLHSSNEMLKARIESVEEELNHWKELYEQDLTDRNRINEMQRKLYTLRGEKLGNESRIAELRIEIGKSRTELLVNREDYAEKVAERLRETQQKKADLKARRVALKDRLERTTIKAPNSGFVVGMTVFTSGAVVKPGATLLEIVPEEQERTVQVRVKPRDIDRVKVGQKAEVRLSAFNQQFNQTIEGELFRISADALDDEQRGQRYFEARVRITDAGWETMQKQGMFLTPGMPAEVMIQTGKRTALEYLASPVNRMVDRAFREE